MARQETGEFKGKRLIPFVGIALMGLVVIACGDPNDKSLIDSNTGKHAENWVVNHRTAYFSKSDQCQECHGADLRGGISKVSCFSASFDGVTCHPGGPVPHALPFTNPALHGSPAKSDLSFCQKCHGQAGTINFSGGLSSIACSTCHTAANAHPTDWQGQGTYSHRTSGNRSVACAICHNVTAAAPAGPNPKAPSCFSANFTNALGQARACHAGGPGSAPHAIPFTAPALHGSPAKTDLSFCQQCHGQPGSINFSGGLAPTACSACHTAASAHPTDWQGLGTYSHRTSGNRSVACAICHNVTAATPAGPNPKAPSCFSATFTNALGQARACHAGGPGSAPHAIPFTAPALHGSPAKSDLSFCQQCHGQPGSINFSGGLAPTACSACHTAASAHPTDWQGLGTYSHITSGNRSVACAICHNVTAATPAGPNPKAPSCFSATFTNALGQARLCHAGGPGSPPHPLPLNSPAQHGSLAKTNLSFCQQCHGQPGTINFSGGLSPTTCSACHTPASAHPTDWQGSGTYTHRNSGNRSVSCAICHNVTAAAPAGPNPKAPSCFSGSFTNALGQARGCHSGGP